MPSAAMAMAMVVVVRIRTNVRAACRDDVHGGMGTVFLSIFLISKFKIKFF